MVMEQKNRFSTLLEHLVATAEVKHFVLAQYLQYDVSYISKWISGRVLPSEKSASDILQKISMCLSDNASKKGKEQLLRDYRVQEPELWQAIYDNLVAEYHYVQDLQQNSGSAVAPNISFFPELSMKKFISKMHHPVLRRVKSLDIMAAIDLFSMAHDYRLQIVSLGGDQHVAQHMYPDVHFSLLINLNVSEHDTIHNTLFITNMLINMARVDFRLYGSDFAYGKAMFVVKNDFSISGMLIRPDTCAAVAVCEGQENSLPLYNNIQSLCTRETMLFRKMDMKEMLKGGMDYVHSLLAPDRRWMLGHMTEHLLPDDIFAELLDSAFGQIPEADRSAMISLHDLTKGILTQGNLQLLIFETAISRFVVTGEVDFFNKKIVLDFRQRAKVVDYLRKSLQEVTDLQVRMIHDPLVSDFQYDAFQSIFLSSTISYLRLNISNQDNNLIMKINRPEMQTMYESFFREVWEADVGVVSDREEIDRFASHLMDGLKLLSNIME